MSKVHVTRRELVASAVAASAVAASVPPAWAKGVLRRRPRVGPGRFRDGVASGEPSASAVTFWSRLETQRPRSGARLVVAKDAGMRSVVATAIIPTGAGLDGSLKARIGGLEPSTEYFYAWESGSDVSPVGRTRTTPPPDSATPVQIAYSSCQHFAHGHFAAHAHAAALPDLDLYLFLGDYVYEKSLRAVRRDPIDAFDLGTYRRKYKLYRTDPALRELHRLQPMAHIWDDHEVLNNYTSQDPQAGGARRAAAYRAAFEWLPRMTFPAERHRLYKRLSLGRHVDVFLLDERQYRTGDADGQPRRMLGDAQMAWLLAELRASKATWKLVAQQVVMASRVNGNGTGNSNGDSPPSDAWDGYDADRTRLLAEVDAANIQNVVVLTGDAHVYMANLLHHDFEALGEGRVARPAAVEYVGGSVTSPGRNVSEFTVQERAPWNRQYDGFRHGYAHLDLGPGALTTEYRAADRVDPAARTVAFERFVQPAGANRFERQTL